MRTRLDLIYMLAFCAGAGSPACSSQANKDSRADSVLDASIDAPADAREVADDAAAPDASLEDAGPLPEITLEASGTDIFEDGKVTLTAKVSGETSYVVSFLEGSTVIGSAVNGPFTHDLTFAPIDAGAHAYAAQLVTPQGVTVRSSTVTVTVSVDGCFVDPVNGLDSNPGTRAAPIRNILLAGNFATPKQSVYLLPAVYNFGQKTSFDSTYTILPRRYRGAAKIGAIFDGGGSGQLLLSKGGALRDIAFQRMANAIMVSGNFSASGLTFDSVRQPFTIAQEGDVTIEAENLGTGWIKHQHIAAYTSDAFLVASARSKVTLRATGTTIEGLEQGGLVVRDEASVIVEGLQMSGLGGRAAELSGNARLTLRNVTIKNSGLANANDEDRASICIGDCTHQGYLNVFASFLTLENSEISATPGPAIVVNLSGASPSTPTLSFTNSHLDNNLGHGLFIVPKPSVLPGSLVSMNAKDTSFDGNKGVGMSLTRASVNLSGGSISKNLSNGIEMTGAGSMNTLKLRGAVVDQNGGDGISFDGAVTSVLDLGSAADPGATTFSKVALGFSALRLDALVTGNAFGNAWMPLTQGSDSNGKYVNPMSLTGVSGANVNVAVGASVSVGP